MGKISFRQWLGYHLLLFAGNNEKKNVEQKDLENLHIGQKRSTFNAVAKEVVIAQEISAPKKKSVIYTRKEGNMPLGGSGVGQNILIASLLAQGYNYNNSFKRLSLSREHVHRDAKEAIFHGLRSP